MIPGIDTGGGGLSNSSSAASGPAQSGGRGATGGSYVKGIDSRWLIAGVVVVAAVWLLKK